MTKAIKWLAYVALAAALAGCAGVQETPPAPTFGEAFTPIDAVAQNAAMARGINVLAGDPGWNDPGLARFKARYFRTIRDAGFSTVRIVMNSFEHMDSSNTLDPHWVAFLDKMVEAALTAGLTVDLDEHDFMLCGNDPDNCRVKLDAFWSQIAPRYKDAPNRLIFEMLNEPHGKLTAALWNAQLKETLAIIRASNPARNVIIGPANWNGLEELPNLELPDDPHIIVTFHYYHPFHFTHQGTTWNGPEIQALHDVRWGTQADEAAMNGEFDTVKAWAAAHNRPIFLGEFGAFETAPLPDRYTWTAAVARGAEAHGFSWAYWQFDHDFVAYDIDKEQWVEPILAALIPPKAAAN
ncbi:MAG: glycoside hydrolase family 5 protein [Alphaproteobacteria bacterium]|nr:glycoside hydrolase family 5 protein [Alphaproteobacteria bacterium]